jgi:hypothetical protein
LNAKTINEYKERFGKIEQTDEETEQPTQMLSSRYGKLADFVRSFFDDRARTLDLICLFILIELYTELNITWVFFLAFLLRQSAIFVASFYSVTRHRLVEDVFESRMKEIIMMINKESSTP